MLNKEFLQVIIATQKLTDKGIENMTEEDIILYEQEFGEGSFEEDFNED